MSFGDMRRDYLGIQLKLRKFGLLNGVAAILFLLGMVSSLWIVPEMKLRSEALKISLSRLEKRLASPDVSMPKLSLAETRLASFNGVLGSKEHIEHYIKTSLFLAQDSGLTVTQADYKYNENVSGKFYTYQITLPIKGTYRSVRQFYEKLLQAFPFASIDEMNFKRDTAISNLIEAQVRFTLFMSSSKSTTYEILNVDDVGGKS
ncbi:hypothetical protein D3C72_344560 [compost metagenome]